jgi:hypothetical protein
MRRAVMLLALTLAACGGTTAPAAPAVPAATVVPLDQLDLESLLVQSGDLPAGISGAQVRDSAPKMFDGMPKALKTTYQQFAQGAKQVGGVAVFLYDNDADRDSAYQFVAKGMGTSLDTLTDTGEKAIATKTDKNDPLAALNFTDVLFQRCAAVAHIRLSGENLDQTAATAYAKRLDKRLSGAVCR